MKLTTLATIVLSANVALGARLTQKRHESHLARRAGRQSQPRMPATDVNGLEIDAFNGTTHPQFSSNWAGAVLIGTGFRSVTGTFVVPTPAAPAGGSTRTQFAASAWVGIDGDTAQQSILQSGIDFFAQGTQITFDAWYEWFPDFAHDFTGFRVSAGDTIKVTVTATTTTSGTAVIQNLSAGTSVTHTFTGQAPGLRELNAEWIVEDFSSGNALVPFADFGSVVFTGATATGSAGTQGPAGATIIDIQQAGQTLTDVTVSGSSVTVNYAG